jgi:acyl-coenzyme A thioesterase PaaI-like protein
MSELDPDLFGRDQPCFGCSPSHPIGFRLRFAVEGDAVVTRFTPGDAYQGPPGILHGGLVATLADEIAAWTVVGLVGKFGFTASFEGRLLRPIRIGREVVGRGTIKQQSIRVVRVDVRVAQHGEDAFAGEFAFALLDRGAAEKLLGGPLLDAWAKLAR